MARWLMALFAHSSSSSFYETATGVPSSSTTLLPAGIAAFILGLGMVAMVSLLCAKKATPPWGSSSNPHLQLCYNDKSEPIQPTKKRWTNPKLLLPSLEGGETTPPKKKMKKGAKGEEGDRMIRPLGVGVGVGIEPNLPVWQRSIMMGERCKPPQFSGLILYDEKGNRLPELPIKSPRFGAPHPPTRVSLLPHQQLHHHHQQQQRQHQQK